MGKIVTVNTYTILYVYEIQSSGFLPQGTSAFFYYFVSQAEL